MAVLLFMGLPRPAALLMWDVGLGAPGIDYSLGVVSMMLSLGYKLSIVRCSGLMAGDPV
jgi:hypothetical protein